MKKKFPWFETLLVIVFMAIQLYAAFADPYDLPNAWFVRDDAYYYFKVAQNISMGLGSTFDGIHLTNGYHPLWLLICVPIFALARFDVILPLRILLIFLSILSLATAILLYRYLSKAISKPVGMLAAIYWTFSLYVQKMYYRSGLEAGIGFFFIVLLLYLLYDLEKSWRKTKPDIRRLALLGLVAALTVFSRLDLVFFAIIVGIWIIFRATPLRYYLPLDILAVISSVLLAYVLRLGFPHYYASTNATVIMVTAGLLVNIPTFYFFGLYQRPSSWKPLQFLRNGFLAAITGSVIISAILLGGDALHILPPFSIAILLMNGIFTFVSISFIRGMAYLFREKNVTAILESPLTQIKSNWKEWLKEGAAYYGVVGGLLSLYMLWNKFTFGTFTPVSGQIKHWWGSLELNINGGSAPNLLSFLMLNSQTDFSAWEPVGIFLKLESKAYLLTGPAFHQTSDWQRAYLIFIVILVLVLCALLLLKKRMSAQSIVKTGLIPLLVGSWLQIYSFNMTGYVTMKEWYWLTEQVAIVIAIGLLLNVLIETLPKAWTTQPFVMPGLVGVLGVLSVFGYWQDTRLQMPYNYVPAGTPYMDVIPFLESVTKPGDVIGMTGGGNTAYFIHDRTIVNMDGLINSYQYFQALKNGTGSDYLYNTGMRYVFANQTLLDGAPYQGQYTNRLQPIINWGGKNLNKLLPKPAP
jgi:hypothetical protein